MMKKLSRILALVLALLLALPSFALAETETVPNEPAAETALEQPEDPVLLTYDGEEITLSQVKTALDNMMQNGYLQDASDYDTAIQALLQDRVIKAKIRELGLDQFTPEEEEALRADAQQQWDEALEHYVSYFLTEDTEEARAKLRQQAETYYLMSGINMDVVLESVKTSASYDKLEAHVLEGVDTTVTEEEVRQVFEQYAEQDRSLYEGNISMYEVYTSYYGYESWYIPEGYRGIIHILLKVEEELLTAYQDAQTVYEEALEEENPDQAKIDAAKAAMDDARDAVLNSKKEVIDQIQARLEQGESFTNLIAEFGEDPGMQNESYLNNGYEVHRESVMFDPVFVAAAFSDKMQQPGDVSDPVVGSYGIHILNYLRDIPSGIVELNGDIYSEIESFLSNSKANSVLNEAVASWMAEHEIVYHDEAIAAAKGQ